MKYALISFFLPGLGEWWLGARWAALGSMAWVLLVWSRGGPAWWGVTAHLVVAALTALRIAEMRRTQ